MPTKTTKTPFFSIIVPVLNGENFLQGFFQSFAESQYKDFEIIINDDKRSKDDTKLLIKKYIDKGLDISYYQLNKSMAQGRKSVVPYAKGEYLMHVDCDMRTVPELMGEIFKLVNQGWDALVIPEEAIGTTFWAKVKWLEKKCYIGVDNMESLRIIKKSIYEEIGGHDERMVFSEDKDFDIRVRGAGYKIGRTKNHLIHNEGEILLFKTSKKKMGYADTANFFAEKHPQHYRWSRNIFLRYGIFLANFKYLFTHPILYVSLFFMKFVEFTGGFLGLVRKQIQQLQKQK